MRSQVLALVAAAALVVGLAGCSTAAVVVGPRVIPVVMTDAMTFEPASITVKQGETVTFDVKNAGQIAHEFFVGNGTAQDEHEVEMKDMSAMGHDHPTGVHVDAGGSKPLTITFKSAGKIQTGCHEPGHWGAGMKGTIVVEL
jgi:uncharacterized cupredoxin-like copper-binding protein